MLERYTAGIAAIASAYQAAGAYLGMILVVAVNDLQHRLANNYSALEYARPF